MSIDTSSAQELWEVAFRRIENQFNKPGLELFVKSIRAISLQGDTLTLALPSRLAKEWAEQRHFELIRSALRSAAGRDLTVSFSVMEPPPAAAATPLPTARPSIPTSGVNGLTLSPKYSFDTFVVGTSNHFAHAAARAVAEGPARAYNPLFIYGGVGLGKTHLLHAIARHVLGLEHIYHVAYATSEKFTNELINSIRDDKTVEFRNKYRTVDVLLIDDIQFLAGKERTQEEFFHTFNTLYESSRQLIITSDRPPKEIPTLEDRLRSRFEWGLIADIQPPDLETRIAILRKKAEQDGIDLPDGVAEFIAQRIQTNIRELEGALVRVVAYATLTRTHITTELTEEVLREVLPALRPRPVTIYAIQRAVAESFDIRVEDMRAKRRTKAIAFPRQVAMYLSREITDASLPHIGDEFGGRDHTTVMHACDRVREALHRDSHLAAQIKSITDRLRQSA